VQNVSLSFIVSYAYSNCLRHSYQIWHGNNQLYKIIPTTSNAASLLSILNKSHR